MEIREGKGATGNIFAFVTLAEDADIKALDTYGVSVNSVVPLTQTNNRARRYAHVPVGNQAIKQSNNSYTMTLPSAGVYIVRLGGKSRKIVVR